MVNKDIRMKFIAIDFETSNPDLSSICQIGTVKFEDGKVSEKWGNKLVKYDISLPKIDFNLTKPALVKTHNHLQTFL